jgi:hypothetical protein
MGLIVLLLGACSEKHASNGNVTPQQIDDATETDTPNNSPVYRLSKIDWDMNSDGTYNSTISHFYDDENRFVRRESVSAEYDAKTHEDFAFDEKNRTATHHRVSVFGGQASGASNAQKAHYFYDEAGRVDNIKLETFDAQDNLSKSQIYQLSYSEDRLASIIETTQNAKTAEEIIQYGVSNLPNKLSYSLFTINGQPTQKLNVDYIWNESGQIENVTTDTFTTNFYYENGRITKTVTTGNEAVAGTTSYEYDESGMHTRRVFVPDSTSAQKWTMDFIWEDGECLSPLTWNFMGDYHPITDVPQKMLNLYPPVSPGTGFSLNSCQHP